MPSGDKTDRHDAWSQADALRLDGHGWRALTVQDPVVAELRLLCRDEVALIEERTALVNQLQQALHEYYPTALEAFDDWTATGAWSFVETFPSPEALTKAGKRKWEEFLHSHKLHRPQTYQKRIDTFQQAGEWHVGAPVTAAKSLLAVARCKQLRVLQLQLDAYRKCIDALFASHPDSGMFGSLPGAGPKLAPRQLGEIGSDRALYHDPQGLQCMAGTAPVTAMRTNKPKIPLATYRTDCIAGDVPAESSLAGSPTKPVHTEIIAFCSRTIVWTFKRALR